MATQEEIQDGILEYLKTIGIATVYEGAIPTGYKLPKQHGFILPYLLVTFGGQSPVALRNQGIDSSKNDVKWTTVACEVVGNSQGDSRRAAGVVRRALEGYNPDPAWGELSETLSGDYAVQRPDYDLPQVRYATGIVFSTMSNAVRPPN